MSISDQDKSHDTTRTMGNGMLYSMWFIAVVLLSYGVYLWQEAKKHPNSVNANGKIEVILEEGRNHHYYAYGKINSQDVLFFVDTGASNVSIPETLAAKLGLTKGRPSLAITANGTVQVYATQLSTLQIGDIVLHDIQASINPGMSGHQILLGMSALKYVDFRREDGQLILRQ